ncbi:ABC transporter permease [Tamlana crocina]|uniref:ABC transporter permease n=1 Tax=Tamlana crocina TaxID=393006 RepID=A0ABX1DDL7_9FLAO|nr:ABC transporter permease [Tamlana crocina]NJX16433.1 ABC transporter permease [Tamlana crocina]
MNIWKISIKNIKSKPFYTFLSIITLALSITLLLGIQQLKSSFQHQMHNNLSNIDVVVGAKGSPLQLILSSVLHLDNPTGNIPFKEAKKIAKNPMVKSVVPISYGDNYKGFRIVGTNPAFYAIYKAEIAQGQKPKNAMEVVLGSDVANQLNLNLGDTFSSSHGLIENTVEVHDEKLTVVGILKPTTKVIDRLIVCNLETVWDVHDHGPDEHSDEQNKNDREEEHNHNDEIHDHEHDHHEQHAHEAEKEVTALLISFRSPMALLTFPKKINEQSNLQAALPKFELDRLFQYTSIGFETINWIAYLILFISALTIFINLYKMVKERAFDLALLRTYGASTFQIIKIVAYEGIIIAFSAFVLGAFLTKTALYVILKFANFSYKQNMIQPLGLTEITQTAGLVFAMVAFSIILAVYPILKMNISTILSQESR